MNAPVIVLGAGMVGTCTALHLALRGHAVLLMDRRGPGEETSYGNAGIIQREAVEPYAFPRDARTLLRAAFKQGAEVNYHWAALPSLAGPLAGYWHHSAPQRHSAIARDYARLIEHSTQEHAPLIALAHAQDLVRQEGFRFVFRTPQSLDEAVQRARLLEQAQGIRHQALDSASLAQAEPALKQRMAGAVHWLDPWTVSDPGELVQRYARHLQQLGGRIVRGDASTLQPHGTGWKVHSSEGTHEAAHVVVALGPWSDALLRPLGYRLPLFPKRGYHRHYQGTSGPRLPLLDADRGLVIAPMKRGVRITTGAEFAALDAPPTPVQLQRAEASARELLDLPQPVEDQPWLGARPCTADMKPVIGPAPRHQGLWFNFGHAHQGFTLGPVSGRLLAEMIRGESTVVPPAPYLPARFGR